MSEWQPIETAPKDGTRVMLWRGVTPFGDWAEMIVAEWHLGAWRWPSEKLSTHGEWTEDEIMDGFCCNAAINWQPLPPPPVPA